MSLHSIIQNGSEVRVVDLQHSHCSMCYVTSLHGVSQCCEIYWVSFWLSSIEAYAVCAACVFICLHNSKRCGLIWMKFSGSVYFSPLPHAQGRVPSWKIFWYLYRSPLILSDLEQLNLAWEYNYIWESSLGSCTKEGSFVALLRAINSDRHVQLPCGHLFSFPLMHAYSIWLTSHSNQYWYVVTNLGERKVLWLLGAATGLWISEPLSEVCAGPCLFLVCIL